MAVALCTLALIASGPVFAASVYVKSMKAKVLAEPRFDSALVAEVERGQELALVEKAERWVKVAVSGREGWVSGLLLSDEPPKSAASVLDQGAEDISGKARRRASAIATAGASRGLTAEGVKELQEADPKADYAALAKVEAQRIDRAEALDFVTSKAGGKGGK